MSKLKSESPQGFTDPTALPVDGSQLQEWQKNNRNWWQSHSMRYDWKSAIPYKEFSKEFYAEIDRRFFASAWRYSPWSKIPFDPLIDFDAIKTKDVLEIGCGNGSHAQLLASHARSYTGIDLTDYAVQSTSTRLSLSALKGNVLRMDAEEMQFPDSSFDFVWSWGVIHHSANTRRILGEIHRVLRPGGRAILMVYHRSFWSYYATGVLLAAMHGDLPTAEAIHRNIQHFSDGAIARYYTPAEWRHGMDGLFKVKGIRVTGQKPELILLPGGRLKNLILRLIPDSVGRFLLGPCRMGSFLISEIEKI